MKKYSLFELFSSQNHRTPNPGKKIIKKILFQTSHKKQGFLYKIKFYSFVSTISAFLIFVIFFLYFDFLKEKEYFENKKFEQEEQNLFSQDTRKKSKQEKIDNNVMNKSDNKNPKDLKIQTSNERMSIGTLDQTSQKQIPSKKTNEKSRLQKQEVGTLSNDSYRSEKSGVLDNIIEFFKILKQIFFQ